MKGEFWLGAAAKNSPDGIGKFALDSFFYIIVSILACLVFVGKVTQRRF